MQQNAVLEGFRKLVRRAIRGVPSGLAVEDQEDVEQEVLLDMYIHLQKTVASDPLSAANTVDHSGLAVVVARRRVIDAMRRKGNPVRSAETGLMGPRSEEEVSLEETVSEGIGFSASPSPEEALLRREATDYLIQRLNANERTLLALVQEGYTDSKIGLLYDLPTQTVKSRLQDLKRKCRKILSAYDTAYASLQARRKAQGTRQKAEEHNNG